MMISDFFNHVVIQSVFSKSIRWWRQTRTVTIYRLFFSSADTDTRVDWFVGFFLHKRRCLSKHRIAFKNKFNKFCRGAQVTSNAVVGVFTSIPFYVHFFCSFFVVFIFFSNISQTVWMINKSVWQIAKSILSPFCINENCRTYCVHTNDSWISVDFPFVC